jgi:hypothetical protein
MSLSRALQCFLFGVIPPKTRTHRRHKRHRSVLDRGCQIVFKLLQPIATPMSPARPGDLHDPRNSVSSGVLLWALFFVSSVGRDICEPALVYTTSIVNRPVGLAATPLR